MAGVCQQREGMPKHPEHRLGQYEAQIESNADRKSTAIHGGMTMRSMVVSVIMRGRMGMRGFCMIGVVVCHMAFLSILVEYDVLKTLAPLQGQGGMI
ncbi:hypothetical protein GGI1_02095 [Acidithiobacillus sp. GGI-221]|nr:hypothetical protein GGI1_02095 [Acidithiobacillus sp. GGI-221]BDB14131.1 hypothetical protein ANFP_14510 [Acidithiobacillus ferrooxidans]